MWTSFRTASEPLLVDCATVGAIPRFAGRRRLPVSLTSIHETTDCNYESIVRIRNSHSISVPKLTRSHFYKHESANASITLRPGTRGMRCISLERK